MSTPAYIREAVSRWLKVNGYDGIWCDGVPCGCLRDDLAPCGESMDECTPGYRREYTADEECGCDCQGEAHWHVGPELKTAFGASEGTFCGRCGAEWRAFRDGECQLCKNRGRGRPATPTGGTP